MKYKKEQKPGDKPASPSSVTNSEKQSPKMSPNVVDYQEDHQNHHLEHHYQSNNNYHHQEVTESEISRTNDEKLKIHFDKDVDDVVVVVANDDVVNHDDFNYGNETKKVHCDDTSGFYNTSVNYFNGFESFYMQNDINLHSTASLKIGENNYEKT